MEKLNIKEWQKKMKQKLETVEQGFGIFKKMTTFVKNNFNASLQTILILVLLGVVILGFYYGSKWIEKILSGSTTYTVQETKESFEMDAVLNAFLDDILIDYKADRAKIIQFHNGTHSLGGVPFRYFSITHEKDAVGVSSEILNYQDVPTSVLGSYAEEMMDKELIVIKDANNIPDTSFRQLVLQQGTLGKCMYPIFDNAGRFTGYLSVDYVGRTVPTLSNGASICDSLVKDTHTVENVLFGE